MSTSLPVPQDSKVSVEEYLAFIEMRPKEERWQLIDGTAMQMPRPTLVHQRIVSNLAHALNEHFRARHPDIFAYCRVGLIVPEAERFRPAADVAVLDNAVDFDTSFSDKFYFVAEVLAEPNTDKDIPAKRQRYLQHPDNLYFVLIEQKRVRAEVLARAKGWRPEILEDLDAVLDIPEWGFRVPLADLYRGTPLAQR